MSQDGKEKSINHKFYFNKIFDEGSDQNMVFEKITFLIDDMIENKKNGLLYSYGKTNSGKTYTMMGKFIFNWGAPNNPGIIPFTLKYLYEELSSSQKHLKVQCNYIEIYNDEIYDLLSNDKFKQKIYLKKIKEKYSFPSKFFLFK